MFDKLFHKLLSENPFAKTMRKAIGLDTVINPIQQFNSNTVSNTSLDQSTEDFLTLIHKADEQLAKYPAFILFLCGIKTNNQPLIQHIQDHENQILNSLSSKEKSTREDKNEPNKLLGKHDSLKQLMSTRSLIIANLARKACPRKYETVKEDLKKIQQRINTLDAHIEFKEKHYCTRYIPYIWGNGHVYFHAQTIDPDERNKHMSRSYRDRDMLIIKKSALEKELSNFKSKIQPMTYNTYINSLSRVKFWNLANDQSSLVSNLPSELVKKVDNYIEGSEDLSACKGPYMSQ